MKIYFDGCSWTKGEELENQEEERYSKLICDKLGAEETNLGMGGGSNDRIVRNLVVENDIKNYDLAVIQMTFPARTEYWDDEWIKVNPKHNYSRWLNRKKEKMDFGLRTLSEKFTDHNQFWLYYYLKISNSKYFNVKEKIHYHTIKNHCKANGVPLILCTINNWSSTRDLLINSYNLPKAHYGHPTKEGHQIIAKTILDKI
tara:strand:- start:605 stop:1207 length:603 start_codon:yes stop_codon:yes gene_type:complete